MHFYYDHTHILDTNIALVWCTKEANDGSFFLTGRKFSFICYGDDFNIVSFETRNLQSWHCEIWTSLYNYLTDCKYIFPSTIFKVALQPYFLLLQPKNLLVGAGSTIRQWCAVQREGPLLSWWWWRWWRLSDKTLTFLKNHENIIKIVEKLQWEINRCFASCCYKNAERCNWSTHLTWIRLEHHAKFAVVGTAFSTGPLSAYKGQILYLPHWDKQKPEKGGCHNDCF